MNKTIEQVLEQIAWEGWLYREVNGKDWDAFVDRNLESWKLFISTATIKESLKVGEL